MLATALDWQVLTLGVITGVGAFVCAAVTLSTGRSRWAVHSFFAFLLSSSYWANVFDAVDDRSTIVSARGIGIAALSFNYIALPFLAWQDSRRGRLRAREAMEIIHQAGALEDQG